MRDDAVKEIHDKFYQANFGTVSYQELLFIKSLISRNRPRRFIEVGMASGLSGGFIAAFMAESGGEYFTSLDHDNTFFGDTTKPNGFLLEEIYSGGSVTVEKQPFRTSMDLPEISPGTFDKAFDMAFIDANHAHPWPLIDTLCVAPFLRGSRLVIHHDLMLFRKQDPVVGIGPKFLYDQFPAEKRMYNPAGNNIFALSLDMPLHQLEDIAANAFSIPWSLKGPLHSRHIAKLLAVIDRYYSRGLRSFAVSAIKKFNGKKVAA